MITIKFSKERTSKAYNTLYNIGARYTININYSKAYNTLYNIGARYTININIKRVREV